MVEQQKDMYTWPSGEEVFFLHPTVDIVAKLDGPEITMMGSRLFSAFNLSVAKGLFSSRENEP